MEKPRGRIRHDSKTIFEICRRRAAGESAREIAAAIGTTEASLRSTCYILRISLRNEHSPKDAPRLDPYKSNPRTIEPIEIRPSSAADSRSRRTSAASAD
jgi:hypothetical protein